MKPFLYLFISLFFHSINMMAQEVPFVEKTIIELRKKDHSGDVPLKLKKHFNWYKRDMAKCESQEYYAEFTQELTEMAIENDIYYQVKVTSNKEGARVRYQTIFERVNKKESNEFAALTNHCTSKLPPGYYYIWCERDGKATSDQKRKIYIFEDTSVELTESE